MSQVAERVGTMAQERPPRFELSENDRAYLQRTRDGNDELVPFMVFAACTLTRLAKRSTDDPLLALELTRALLGMPEGFLTLAHQIDSDGKNFFEHLAAFRAKRIAAEEAAADQLAGISSPP